MNPMLLTWLRVLREDGPISTVDWKMVAGWALDALGAAPAPVVAPAPDRVFLALHEVQIAWKERKANRISAAEFERRTGNGLLALAAAPLPVVAPAPADEYRRLKGIIQVLSLGASNRDAYVEHAMLCDARFGKGPCECGYAEVEAVMKECSACPREAVEDGLCDPCHAPAAPLPVEGNRKLTANSAPLPVETPRHLIHDFAEGSDGAWRCACGATSVGPLTGVLASPPLPVETDATPDDMLLSKPVDLPALAAVLKKGERREGLDHLLDAAPAPLDDGGDEDDEGPLPPGGDASEVTGLSTVARGALDDGETGGARWRGGCTCGVIGIGAQHASTCPMFGWRGPSGTPGGGT